MHAYSHVSPGKMQYCVPLTPVVGAYSKLCKERQYWYPMEIEIAHIFLILTSVGTGILVGRGGASGISPTSGAPCPRLAHSWLDLQSIHGHTACHRKQKSKHDVRIGEPISHRAIRAVNDTGRPRMLNARHRFLLWVDELGQISTPWLMSRSSTEDL